MELDDPFAGTLNVSIPFSSRPRKLIPNFELGDLLQGVQLPIMLCTDKTNLAVAAFPNRTQNVVMGQLFSGSKKPKPPTFNYAQLTLELTSD